MSSMLPSQCPLAIVTGASSGIGCEFAKCRARDGFDLLVAADEPAFQSAADDFRKLGSTVNTVQADLSTTEGVDALYSAVKGHSADALLANVGRSLGRSFLDSFSFALRHEVKDQGITVTCLIPGATETELFEHADVMDTKIGTAKKDNAAEVAETGFKAMMKNEG